MIFAKLRDMHQNHSWKIGYLRGKRGRPFGNPWWADKVVYGLAYMKGKGVDIEEALKSMPDVAGRQTK
jgi:hypothetical protein